LLQRDGVSKGLAKLAELQRLDLAMETLVLDPTYGPLFTDAEREAAARRLSAARLTETPDRHSLPP
jgi:hypothetical protein